MANTAFPVGGWNDITEAGDPIVVETIRTDLNFLHASMDDDPLIGHDHSEAGKGAKIGIEGLTQEAKLAMSGKGFKHYLVPATSLFQEVRVLTIPHGTNSILLSGQTPINWDSLIVINCRLKWIMSLSAIAYGNIASAKLEISADGIAWTECMDITGDSTIPYAQTKEIDGIISETQLPFFWRIRGVHTGAFADPTITLTLGGCLLEGSVNN
ncbi:MAG: hypothetical protein WC623_24400 [Pedobacter sp.]|uniref:hypothetical protein n=1 Tax=Pedobacter sp. TaxID=1411316 RepID=UPI0035637352